MMVKKIVLMGIASVATLGLSVALAGGPAAQVSHSAKGLYVGMDLGAVYNASYSRTSAKHMPWGWSASGLVGYQFANHWSTEMGYVWNQNQVHSSGTTKAWNMYLGFKGTLALTDQIDGYLMVGPAYTHHIVKGSGEARSYYSPMAAAGVNYMVEKDLEVNFQYMLIASRASQFPVQSTSRANSQRLTVGARYQVGL